MTLNLCQERPPLTPAYPCIAGCLAVGFSLNITLSVTSLLLPLLGTSSLKHLSPTCVLSPHFTPQQNLWCIFGECPSSKQCLPPPVKVTNDSGSLLCSSLLGPRPRGKALLWSTQAPALPSPPRQWCETAGCCCHTQRWGDSSRSGSFQFLELPVSEMHVPVWLPRLAFRYSTCSLMTFKNNFFFCSKLAKIGSIAKS